MADQRFKLKLYVEQANSRHSLLRLYKALEFHRYSDYELVIVDVAKEPTAASNDGVVTTPTLVLHQDGDSKIVFDDFNNIDELRQVFGFRNTPD